MQNKYLVNESLNYIFVIILAIVKEITTGETVMSQPPATSKHGQNLIVFPREYVIDADHPENSLVHGVDEKGVPVTVALKVSPDYLASVAGRSDKSPPSLYEYSRTGRKARMPCVADPANGPEGETREGVLLFSKAHATGENTWDAGWAIVLATDNESPMPMLGLGRLENRFIAKFESDGVKALRAQLAEIKQASSNPKTDPSVLQLEEQIVLEQTVKMAVVLDKLEETSAHASWESAQTAVVDALVRHTHGARGTYGGATLRLRHGDVTVRDLTGTAECGLFKNTPITPDMAVTTFLNWGGGKKMLEGFAKLQKLHPGAVIEVIPYELINYGPQGNAMYKKPDTWKGFQNTFTDHNDRSVSIVCPIAVRPFVIEDGRFAGNMIVSDVYAVGLQKGSVLTLNAEGERQYTPTALATLLDMKSPEPV